MRPDRPATKFSRSDYRLTQRGFTIERVAYASEGGAVGLFKRKKGDEREVVDPEERSPQLGLKYKDLFLLTQMQEQGANLDEPRHVLHFLYFASEMQAQAAHGYAQQQGWQAEVREPLPEYPGQWSLVCEQPAAVLAPEFVRGSTDFFEALAANHAGEYDGWEAAL